MGKVEIQVHAEQEVGPTIRRIRLAKGLTQRDLAKRLGVSQKTVSRYENGPSLIGTSILLHVLDALDCTLRITYETKGDSDAK